MSEEDMKAAQQKLDAAIEQFLSDVGWKRGMVTTGWVMISHQIRFDDSSQPEEAYPIVYMDGSMSDHVAMGLLLKGLDILRGMDPHHRREEGEEPGE